MADCSICLESLDDGVVITTACKHQFHLLCLTRCLVADATNDQCPLCRGDLAETKTALAVLAPPAAATAPPPPPPPMPTYGTTTTRAVDAYIPASRISLINAINGINPSTVLRPVPAATTAPPPPPPPPMPTHGSTTTRAVADAPVTASRISLINAINGINPSTVLRPVPARPAGPPPMPPPMPSFNRRPTAPVAAAPATVAPAPEAAPATAASVGGGISGFFSSIGRAFSRKKDKSKKKKKKKKKTTEDKDGIDANVAVANDAFALSYCSTARHPPPNFRQSSRSFDIPDDEPLAEDEYSDPEPRTTSTASTYTSTGGDSAELDQGDTLSMAFTTEFEAVAASQEREVYAMLTVVAPEEVVPAEEAEDDGTSLPLDIVVVCDTSGSMGGDKMDLLAEALGFLNEELSDRDRLSIIEFNSTAKVVSGLKRTHAAGKVANAGLISTLYATGGTDIGAGLSLGLQVLQRRRQCNPVSSILLLSDGQDSTTSRRVNAILADNSTPVHVFGLGAGHDAVTLASIAEAGNGTFTYVEGSDGLGTAFASVLGGVSSVVAQDVCVTITANGAVLTALKTTFPGEVDDDGLSATVTIADMRAGETRDLVFTMRLPHCNSAPDQAVLGGAATYTTPGAGNDQRRVAATGVLDRPAVVEGLNLANRELDAQRNRVIAAEALEASGELANRDLPAARLVVDGAIETLEGSVSASADLVVALLRDLRASRSHLTNQRRFENGGRAFIKSSAQSHKKQRAVQVQYDNGETSYGMYANTKMTRKVAAYGAYKGSLGGF